jgi:LysM repeat protein
VIKTPRTAVVLVCALAVAFASACGGDDGDSDATSTTTASTATVTATLASTAAPPAVTSAAETTVATSASAAPGTHTVVGGDSLFRIADRYCVTIDELVAANAWPEGVEHVIHPDDIVQLPPNACAPGSSPSTTSVASSEPATSGAPTSSP